MDAKGSGERERRMATLREDLKENKKRQPSGDDLSWKIKR